MKSTEYIQISTRVRASLGSMSHGDRIRKAIDSASSISSLTSAIRSMMMQDTNVTEDAGFDTLCDIYLGSAISLVRALAPQPGIYDSLFYKYDAANLKLCIKSSLRSLDTPELFPYGTVDTKIITESVETRNFSRLPAGLARGCAEALEEYSSTGNAIAVDLSIDRGCFEDIRRSAKLSEVPLLGKIASFDADCANVTAFARICAMKLPTEAKRPLFNRAFVSGGEIARERFPAAEFSFAAMKDSISGTHLSSTFHSFDENEFSTAALESDLKKKRIGMLDGVKFVPFGADVPAAYILEREAEVRAFALIGAYISRGASTAEIADALA